jgi:hypothetical protein
VSSPTPFTWNGLGADALLMCLNSRPINAGHFTAMPVVGGHFALLALRAAGGHLGQMYGS